MRRRPLSLQQEAQVAEVRELYAKWFAHSTGGRLARAAGFIAALWALLALGFVLVSGRVGVSGAGIALTIFIGALPAAALLWSAIRPEVFIRWVVRVMPGDEYLKGPWLGFGDIRPDDVERRGAVSTSRRARRRFATAAEVVFGASLIAGLAAIGSGVPALVLLAIGAIGLAFLAVIRFAARHRPHADRLPEA